MFKNAAEMFLLVYSLLFTMHAIVMNTINN